MIEETLLRVVERLKPRNPVRNRGGFSMIEEDAGGNAEVDDAAQPSTDDAQILQARNNKYSVDAPTRETEVLEVDGERKMVVAYSFDTITRDHMIGYGKKVIDRTIVIKGIETSERDAEKANVALFDWTTQGGYGYPYSMSLEQAEKAGNVTRFTREQALKIKAEKKSVSET
jgi:hypothetical protein